MVAMNMVLGLARQAIIGEKQLNIFTEPSVLLWGGENRRHFAFSKDVLVRKTRSA